jgi:tRNA-splicing ligase RtcB
MRLAIQIIKRLINEGIPAEQVRSGLLDVIHDPAAATEHSHWGPLAQMILAAPVHQPRETPAPWRQWGTDIDDNSIQQMRNACELPVSVAGALMPDAHVGYGLPIGGVLATDNAVIPYAVGVDIACRMKLTVLDVPLRELEDDRGRNRLAGAIERQTLFGAGAGFRGSKLRRHEVLDRDWRISPITIRGKDKAWKQLGTSGSGNHFVEFGILEIMTNDLGLEPGMWLALLSHSGSRGIGHMVASHYSSLAMQLHPELPENLRHLAWLDMDSQEGIEYWNAMNLMGEYAAANHACIHRHIAEDLGAEVLLDVENHHNFAWKETHDGRDVYVHRKGATPAGKGVLGVIPGSMASPAFVVRGLGKPESLNSASHGAGRVMSRSQAKKALNWQDANRLLEEQGVSLMSAGIDEVPMVYKDIHEVMAAQSDLVETLACFRPRIVKMAPAGERPED